MGKIVDITEKLSFEGNPKLKIKGIELEVNADAKTTLRLMQILGDGDNITPSDMAEMCELIMTKESQEKLDKLSLSFQDYQTVIMESINLITGDAGEIAGE